MIGGSSNVFLLPLARALKSVNPSLILEVNGLKFPSGGFTKGSQGEFDRYLPAIETFLLRGPKTIPVICNDSKVRGWKSLSRWFSRKKSSPEDSRTETEDYRIKAGDYLTELEDSVDLIHLQGLLWNPIYLHLAEQTSKPLVVSCWGTEVMGRANMSNCEKQQKILSRASAITVSGPEFKEIVLAKYGRDLAPKIHIAYFDPNLGELPVSEKSSSSKKLRNFYGVRDDQLLLCLAHNGSEQNQHLALLNSLSLISTEIKQRLYILAPMTYGGNDSYMAKVSTAIENAGLSGQVISNYMSEKEMHTFRMSTDIFLYAPVSDVFSGSVSQALSAGSVSILGSWLPYKARTSAGFRYHEIDSTGEAGACLQRILLDWENALVEAAYNRDLSAQFFSQDRIGRQWSQAYEAAVHNHAKTQKEELINESES
jgi:glycosyltransferase involved in cell wall biosynthesis